MSDKRNRKIVKALSLVAAFLLTLVITSLVTNHENSDLTEEMDLPGLPRITFLVDDYAVNELHGYTEEMDIPRMRDTITPVSVSSGAALQINANEKQIQSVAYTIWTLDGKETLYEGTAEPADEVALSVGDVFSQVDEAVLEVTLSYTDEADGADAGGEAAAAHYYTRIADGAELNAKQVLSFVSDFHAKTFDKTAAASDLATYMESGTDEDDDSLRTVTIGSSMTQLSWGDLEISAPEQVSIEIKESNSSYSAVLLCYQVTCAGDDETEDTYNVREFFRVRYTKDRTYLLSYNRTMGELFDPEEGGFSKSGITLGITDPDVEYMTNADGTVVAFVQERELWNYDSDNDRISRVFSFGGDNSSDSGCNYDQHEIRIISVDEDGSTTFMVCGYMNRDENEGRVGAAVYRFDSATNCVEEKAFIPSDKSYEVMTSEIGQLVYYNETDDVLYVMVDTTLYRVYLSDDRQEVFLDDMQSGEYVFADDGHVLAYQTDSDADGLAKSCHIVNLETGTDDTVQAENGERMKAIGFIENDFIYGVADETESGTSLTGEQTVPMESVRIVDDSQKLLKEYGEDGVYILDASVEGNMITLRRAQKKGGSYVAIDDDYITNNEEQDTGDITLTTFTSEKKQTQMRLSFANGIDDTTPNFLRPKQLIYSNPITLSFEAEESDDVCYVYGNGGLVGIYDRAGDAVAAADECDGVVVAADQSVIWERGNRYLTASLTEFPLRQSKDGETALQTCLTLVSAYAGNETDYAGADVRILTALAESTKGTALDLTGCTAEETLYLISNGYPVLLMRSASDAVVVTGYDQTGTITYFDPGEGKTHTVTQEKFEALAEESGNAFFSYIAEN